MRKVYDDKVMAHYKSNRFNHVNPYCRYLTLTTSASLHLLSPDKLNRFDVSDSASIYHTMRVLYSNPLLKHLSWLRPVEAGPIIPAPAPRAFFDTLESLLTQLQTLVIGDRWVCRLDQLSCIIKNNPGLRAFDVVLYCGLEASEGWMVMPSVTTLNPKSLWSENPGATQLIQHFPNLEGLTILLNIHRLFVKVSEILGGTCTQVTVLRIKQSASVQNLPDVIGQVRAETGPPRSAGQGLGEGSLPPVTRGPLWLVAYGETVRLGQHYGGPLEREQVFGVMSYAREVLSWYLEPLQCANGKEGSHHVLVLVQGAMRGPSPRVT